MKSVLSAFVYFWLFLSLSYSQTTVVIQPGPAEGKDAYINSYYFNNPGGPNDGLMACAWTFGGEFGIGRTLIRFDLSQIPSGAQILDARLTLFYDPEVAFGEQYGENASYLEKIIQDWNEMTVTWSTKPLSTGAGAVFIPKTQSSDQDITDVNIAGFVSEWVLHPETNFGFSFRMANEIEYCCLVCSSSDNPIAAKRPKLVVTYRDCDPAVAGFGYHVQVPKVSFFDSSNSAMSWYWDFGDGYFSNLQNPVHIYAQPGIYQACLAIEDSCGKDTICDLIHVCNSPDPHFSYVDDGNMVRFADSSIEPLSWFWDFNDGFYSDLKDPQHHFNESGTYFVCEKVTNVCNVQTYCDSVKVVANAIGDKSKTFGMSIYPNPARDMIFLRVNVQVRSNALFELFTPQNGSLRKWVREINPADKPISLNITGLSPGIYFLQTKIDGMIKLNKLIIL